MSKIITTEELAQYLNIKLDEHNTPRLERVVASVNAYVEQYTHHIFGETRNITESHDLEPYGVIFLNFADVVEVTSLKVNGEQIQAKDMRVNKTIGRVAWATPKLRPEDFMLYDGAEVEYLCGSENVPADLKLATLQMASDSYNRRDSQGANVVSESVGDYSISFGNTSSQSDGSTNNVRNVLDRYVLRHI